MGDDGIVTFGNDIDITKPYINKGGKRVALYPRVARDAGLDYVFEVKIEVKYKPTIGDERSQWITLGKVPAMVGSVACNLHRMTDAEKVKKGECPSDFGGYFIVGGSEKVLSCSDTLRANRVSVHPKDTFMQADLTTKSTRGTTNRKMKIGKDGIIMFPLPTQGNTENGKFPEVNVFALMSLIFPLGQFSSDEERYDFITRYILQFSPPEYKELVRIKMIPTKSDMLKHGDYISYINRVVGSDKIRVAKEGSKFEELSKRDAHRDYQNRMIGEAFSHLDSDPEPLQAKLNMFSYMIVKFILTVVGKINMINRDDWGNKNVVTPGRMFYLKLLEVFWIINGVARNQAMASTKNVSKFDVYVGQLNVNGVNRNMSRNFVEPLRKEKWTMYNKVKEGVVKTPSRKSALDPISLLRKIVTPVGKFTKSVSIRALQATQLFAICIAETPEGEKCGINKHLALTANITIDVDQLPVRRFLYEKGYVVKFWLNDSGYNEAIHKNIFIMDGIILGKCDGKKVRKILTRERRDGRFSREMSVVLTKDGDLVVSNEAGRIIFPVFVVETSGKNRGRAMFDIKDVDIRTASWEEMVEKNVVEYLDVYEASHQYGIRIATSLADFKSTMKRIKRNKERFEEDPENRELERIVMEEELHVIFSHISIHPVGAFGVSGSYIIMANHNHAPKMAHQCNHSRQAMGPGVGNKATGNLLSMIEPTTPLVQTNIYKTLGFTENPMGRNVMMAILAHPYAQEDAIVVNQNLIDLGGFLYQDMKIITLTKKEDQVISYPGDLIKNEEKYHAIDKNSGMPLVGARVKPGDIILGKRGRGRGQTGVIENISEKVPEGTEGTIVDVIESTNSANNKIISVKIAAVYSPEIADKFSTRQAQKAVIGKIVPNVDMPFATTTVRRENFILKLVDGFDDYGNPTKVPEIRKEFIVKLVNHTIDVIISPHAIPTRMTIATPLEMLLGKAAAIKGETFDATTYRLNVKEHIDDAKRLLASYGMTSVKGFSDFRSGITGELMEGDIFTGVMFLQQLKHIARHKEKTRCIGKVSATSRQSHSGKGGGIKLGEMEKDALLTYGASHVIHDAFLIRGGPYPTTICKRCRRFGTVGKKKTSGKVPIFVCKVCADQDTTKIASITIPFILKTFIFYLNGMGIDVRLNLTSET